MANMNVFTEYLKKLHTSAGVKPYRSSTAISGETVLDQEYHGNNPHHRLDLARLAGQQFEAGVGDEAEGDAVRD